MGREVVAKGQLFALKLFVYNCMDTIDLRAG